MLLLSEKHIFISNKWFHHKSLVSDVVKGCHGIKVWGPHQRRAEHDAQILTGHQVFFLIKNHSV